MKLTKKIIDAAARPNAGQRFLRDGELRGFAVRLTRNTKSFILEREINGRVRRLTIGRYGPLTVEEAREEARKKVGEIAKGFDPADERQQRRRGATFQELQDLYLERHASRKKSKKNDLSILKNHLSQWRSRKLTTITRSDVAALHAAMGKQHPTWANRTVALLRTMFNLAKDWGLHDGENPASRIKFFNEVKRDRFVHPDELPRLWKAVQGEPSPFVRAAFFIGLLTGARREEVLRMKWRDLDLQQGIWHLPDTKAGHSHFIPLPRPVIEELHRLPRLAGNEYVLCGRRRNQHLVNVAKPWRRIRKEAGLEDVRLHDLRRTLGSWLVAAGASLPLIGKVLNHSDPETTQIYARLQLDPVRAALEENATRMLRVIGQPEETAVGG